MSQRSPASSSADRWQRLGPGGGGATFIPTFSHSDPDKILLRCDMTGSYLSTDGGESWAMHNFPGGIGAYAFDPSDSRTLYVGARGLHRSTDGGQSWHLLLPRPHTVEGISYHGDHADCSYITTDEVARDKPRVCAIGVDWERSALIYIGMGAHLLCSEDGGESWTEISVLDDRILTIYTHPSLEGAFVFTPGSLYRFSRDSGELAHDDLSQQLGKLNAVAAGHVPETGSTRFYALTDSTWDGTTLSGGIHVSDDAGENWRSSSHGLTDDLVHLPDDEGPGFCAIATPALESGTAYVICHRHFEPQANGAPGLWYGALKTSDAGASWQWVYRAGGGAEDYTIRDGQEADNVRDSWVREAFSGEFILLLDVGVYPRDGDIAIVTDWYRTMKTEDGGRTWREVYSTRQPDGSVRSRGLDVTTSYGIHFDPFDPDHIAISYTDIGYHHSFDGGHTWNRSVEGVPPTWDNTCYWMIFDPDVEGKIWSVWSSLHDFPRGKMTRDSAWTSRGVGGVCVSTDGGHTWTVSNSGLGETAPTTGIVLDPRSPSGNRTLYVSVYGKGVFKSTDDGRTWQPRNDGLGKNRHAWELTVREDGTLYLVLALGPQFADDRPLREPLAGEVYVSRDGAESWSSLPLPPEVLFPNSLTPDPRDPHRLYLSCWADIDLGDVIGGQVARETGGNLPIPSAGGVFTSQNGGQTWRSIFDQGAYVYGLSVDSCRPGRLYINTFNHSAHYSDDCGETWSRIAGYDFHWGHRVFPDPRSEVMIYLTTFGGSVFYGPATGIA